MDVLVGGDKVFTPGVDCLATFLALELIRGTDVLEKDSVV